MQLAYRETGSGRPLILLHGFMGMGSDWLDHGPGYTLAETGFRLVLPDFRGHGQSPRPRDLPAYPPDVLADDALALIRHLGLGAGEYDLGGYSLGGRIVVRMLARGAGPGRAVVAGQGLAKIAGPQGGGANRRALTALAEGIALPPDSADAQIAHWAAELGADPRALLCVLGSLVPTPEDDLRRIMTPTLVVIGDRDERSDAGELAALLPAGRFARVPGGHGGAFAAPELAAVIKAFLATRPISRARRLRPRTPDIPAYRPSPAPSAGALARNPVNRPPFSAKTAVRSGQVGLDVPGPGRANQVDLAPPAPTEVWNPAEIAL